MLEDTSFEPTPTDEEMEQQQLAEQEAELARKIRREVKRIQIIEAESGSPLSEQDDDAIEEVAKELAAKELEEQERAEQEREEEKIRRRQKNILWQLISGQVLLLESVSKYYRHMIGIAVLFFISIVVMFASLHLDMRYGDLSRSVQLTRERSVRLQEMVYLNCSRSAITKKLQSRGIDIYEPEEPATIIKNTGRW